MRLPILFFVAKVLDQLPFQGLARRIIQFWPQETFHLIELDPASAFSEFVCEDGRRISLYEGYRNQIKSKWILDYWPVDALLRVQNRVSLNSKATALLSLLKSARTLPVDLNEVADIVVELAKANPKELVISDISSALTESLIVAARLPDKLINAIKTYYSHMTSRILLEYAHWNGKFAVDTLSTLEVGCGMGYSVIAMAKSGVGSSAGIDYAPPDFRWVCERPEVLKKFGFPQSGVSRRVRILEGDISRTSFQDAEFDLIYSASVLEHVHDLRSAFAEMSRLLKPGGLMFHGVDPYFSPRGGHSSCTLDFPWGHARLSPSDFRRYIKQYRSHEFDHAITMYDYLFNVPRVSLSDIERAVSNAGLVLLSWKENWVKDHLPSFEVWRDVIQVYPFITSRDLMANSLKLVILKP
jgi:ubiquinone/menaquinone biosynthesis C-methylase UbiE